MGRVSRFLFGIGCVFLACRAAFAADSPLPKDERAVVITARILTLHGPIPAELEKKLTNLQRDPKKPKETRKIAEVVDAAPLEVEIRKTVFRRKAEVYTLSDTMHTLMGHQASLARGAELPPEVVNRPREIRWASGIMLECRPDPATKGRVDLSCQFTDLRQVAGEGLDKEGVFVGTQSKLTVIGRMRPDQILVIRIPEEPETLGERPFFEERDDLPKANRATSRYFLMSLKLVEPVDTH